MRRLSASILAITVLLLLAGCERAKTKLDREVDRLCAIDGGVHVYETVKLPKENFGPQGEVFPQYRGLASDRGGLGPSYQGRFNNELLVPGDPALQRIRNQIIRLADKKVLGELVVYRRSGGDLPGPWEPSRYSCPTGPVFNLEQQVFKSQGEKE
ncbi:MAG: hypothetical protein H0X13_04675 [Ramlibacter sp.]|nr:hypothetical protein [Ramlibacter sp.]